jgi:hypothetical protein
VNNGGFVQVALDLAPRAAFDASGYRGLRLVVRGNARTYNLHLATLDLSLPWQSYRNSFPALPTWRQVSLPFATFVPYRVEAPLDLARLSRIGILALGSSFTAEVCLAQIGFY